MTRDAGQQATKVQALVILVRDDNQEAFLKKMIEAHASPHHLPALERQDGSALQGILDTLVS